MATYVSRTATTPILNQSNERNATILEAHGRLAALSVGIPQFMLSSTLPVRFASEFFEGDLYPGDVHRGQRPIPRRRAPAGRQRVLPGVRRGRHGCCCSPRSSATTVTPAARWPAATTSSPRTSGARVCGIPLLKIIDAGKERRDVVLTMRANNRLPGFIGDLRSQVGAAQLGARRLDRNHRGVRRRHRRGRRQLVHRRCDRRFSAEIAGWPDGTYEADVYVDSDPAGNTGHPRARARSPSRATG